MTSEEHLSKRPKETQFYQQTLQAWNPSILMSTVFPFFAGFGSLFIFIGVILVLLSMSVREINLDYTNCKRFDGNSETKDECSQLINRTATSSFQTCKCVMPFTVKEQIKGQVYMYYVLQNMYQNHRRYAQSRDTSQLSGYKSSVANCAPYDKVKNGSQTLVYAPCGVIANSIFNDTFMLRFIEGGTPVQVNMSSRGIAWKVDTAILYGRPKDWNNTIKPINWPKTALERNINSYDGDEELLVWMRTAPFSNFKKLHRIIDHDQEPFRLGLPKGNYELTIDYAYPVTMFDGRKSVVLSTTSSMGGKNHSMGIMYLVVGTLQLIIAIMFAVGTCIKRDPRHPSNYIQIAA